MRKENGKPCGASRFCTMSAIRDGRYPVILGGVERHLLFDLNVLDEMQDKFGGFDMLTDILQGDHAMKNLKWLLTLLINEGRDDGEPEINERQAGRFIHVGNMKEITESVLKAFSIGNSGTTDIQTQGEPGDDEETDEDGEEKNMEPGKE